MLLLTNFHDIGKVVFLQGTESTGDNFQAEVASEEMGDIRRHAEIGYRIAKGLPELAPIAEDILAHHEHWDGSGYPNGLQGENIPLLARIIAVVSGVDRAMNEEDRDPDQVLKRVMGVFMILIW